MLRPLRRAPAGRASGRALTASRLCAAALLLTPLHGQDATQGGSPGRGSTSAPERGLRRVDPRWHALIHARAITAPGVLVEDATIVLRDGLVASVAAGASPPEGARVHDCSGLVVHAAFVEAHLAVDAPLAPAESDADHWHHLLVTPQRSALDGAGVDAALAKGLRSIGFGAAAIAPRAGVFRGTASVVALGDGASELEDSDVAVIAEDVWQVLAFDRAGFGARGELGYPNSEMGAIALVRQTSFDAAHHAAAQAAAAAAPELNPPVAPNRALEALLGARAFLFDARTELQTLRAAKLGRELGWPLVVLGSGQEYRRLEAVRATGLPVLAPLTFDEAPDVGTIDKQEALALRDLMAWEQAPTNPRRLAEAGVRVALTTSRLEPLSEFPARVRKALDAGLGAEAALAMLTTVPAELLGVDDRLGRIAPGQCANLVVLDGEPFGADTKVRDVWVMGRRHVVNAAPGPDRTGAWDAVFPELGGRRDVAVRFLVEAGDKLKLRTGEGEAAETVEARDVAFGRHDLHFHLDGAALGLTGVLSLSGLFEGDVLHGRLVGPGGVAALWRATRDPAADRPEPAAEGAAPEVEGEEGWRAGPPGRGRGERGDHRAAAEAGAPPAELGVPFGAYGLLAPPAQRDVRVEGATLWTSGPRGIVADGVLVVTAGKVVYAGPRDGAPTTPSHEVVDGRGKHVTPGLIDCHSHTGVSGSVNEGGQRVTCEVRIADVIDPDDIAFYHQLAGGLTAANQLHGSANAIGGQNSVVKLRWGVAHPDDMRLAGAPAGVKFALGENPKRVAAGTEQGDEYPQTRLGVEALIRDRLAAGRHYVAERARYEALSEWERRRTAPPRRDLELEALGEIVSGTRWIHSHSYRQDEILMLARVAQEHGIRIGTFQHVLEGYKVAEAVKESARGASSFADWWAYKFEVIDAIPDSPAIMHEVGVCVSINSDSDEHARRLNTEAAKGMKYGGMSPHDALCMVTLNPAIQLGVEDRVGSLEPGKDADFALWSGDPLSYASRCEATWIDGREHFSLARDAELRAEAARERERLVQKLLAERGGERRGGAGAGGRRRPGERLASGELTLREAYELGLHDEIEALWRAGNDPRYAQPGVCGCWDVFLGEEGTR